MLQSGRLFGRNRRKALLNETGEGVGKSNPSQFHKCEKGLVVTMSGDILLATKAILGSTSIAFIFVSDHKCLYRTRNQPQSILAKQGDFLRHRFSLTPNESVHHLVIKSHYSLPVPGASDPAMSFIQLNENVGSCDGAHTKEIF